MATRSADIPLVPLTSAKFSSLRDRDDVSCQAGGTPKLGDRSDVSPRESFVYTGECERFDLSKEDDRKKYADITAKLYSGMEYHRLWEEKTTGPSGELIVYLSYIRYMQVYSNGNDNFNLHEDS
jgi:hypothetical protein